MTKSVGARPVVAVDGKPLAEDVQALLRTVVVDTDSAGPDSCRIALDDPGREALRHSGIDLRCGLTVTAGRIGDETGEEVFDGVVYALGFEFDDRGSFTSVVAYDRSYELYTGLHTVTYQNVTDSDLASRLAGEVGLQTGTLASTPVVHEHVSQVNETHYDFLARRAREVDCQVIVSGRKLSFVPSVEASKGPEPGDLESVNRLQLVPGQNVERLTTRVSAAQQVTEVEVRGWDPHGKQAVVATAPARTRTARLRDRPDQIAASGSGARHVTVDLPLSTQAECDAVAKAQAERIAGTCVHAEGVAKGDPRIVAGAAVSLGRTGEMFDGQVTVTRAKHVWDERGYRTTFAASGANDRSVFGLVTGDVDRSAPGKVGGLVIGVVTNVSDPQNRGRAKLRFPWLSADYESDWARVLQLGAGHDRGLMLLPEVNDEVLVGFEQGDMRRPYLLGGLFNGVDGPVFGSAVDSAAGTVSTRGWRTRSGHELVFQDADGQEKIELRTKSSKVSLVLDATDGSLRIETKGDLTITADGKGTISARGGLSLTSDGEVTIRGTTIKLN